MCAEGPGSFIENGGYHFEEEAKSNLVEPRNGDGGGRRRPFVVAPPWLPHARSITAVGGASTAEELPPPIRHPLNRFRWHVHAVELPVVQIVGWSWLARREN